MRQEESGGPGCVLSREKSELGGPRKEGLGEDPLETGEVWGQRPGLQRLGEQQEKGVQPQGDPDCLEGC